MKPHLHIAIPAMDELDFLPYTLSSISAQQTDFSFSVYICVNQPDEWWEDPKFVAICERNAELIRYLSRFSVFPVHLIDRSSKGNGWKGKNFGVGFARKTLFETIVQNSDKEDIIISLDADTQFGNRYFQSIGEFFESHPQQYVMANPYYHPLKTEKGFVVTIPDKMMIQGDTEHDRAILRYELYLRNWHLNLAKIGSPYAFTALGSVISFKVWAIQKIGGITPLKSGEDFYLLQKFRKMGTIAQWNSEVVFPAARFSNRVLFGTGPAMIKGAAQDWSSYPIFHHTLFIEIAKSYKAVSTLFEEELEMPFLAFLKEQFNENDLWGSIRKNAKSLSRFERAFHEKADGLRLFQFVRKIHKIEPVQDEDALRQNLTCWLGGKVPDFLTGKFSFEALSIAQLNKVRDLMFATEAECRKSF